MAQTLPCRATQVEKAPWGRRQAVRDAEFFPHLQIPPESGSENFKAHQAITTDTAPSG